MSVFVACPSCERQLRVPEELLGKQVKCPSCATTFDAQAPSPEPPPLPSPPAQSDTVNLPPMNLSREDSPPPSDSPPLGTPQSVSPNVPEQPPTPSANADLEPCPYCGEQIRKLLLRCPYCEEQLQQDRGEEDEREERPWERGDHRQAVRRDCEPHRASLVLILGIVSIPLGLVGMCCGLCSYGVGGLASVVGLGLGISAWVMGHRDQVKMRAGVMDPEGMSQTQSGMICGVVGTSLNALGVLASLVMLVIMIVVIFAGSMVTPPGPIAPPRPPPPPKFQIQATRLLESFPHRLAQKG